VGDQHWKWVDTQQQHVGGWMDGWMDGWVMIKSFKSSLIWYWQ
jgi:hypothetical protein